MRYLPDGTQMKAADLFTIEEKGIPSLVLMERAAEACVEEIEKLEPDFSHICVVCGAGNNGGDGFAIARIFARKGRRVSVTVAGKPERFTEETLYQKKLLDETEAAVSGEFQENEYSIIIDALFGVGLSREITGACGELVDRMNAAKGVKVAVDIPSGICAGTGRILGTAFRADYTITFQAEKLGHVFYPGCAYAGKTRVADIGIREEAFAQNREVAETLEREEYRALLPERKTDSHKGTYGRVLMISGSTGMCGAAYLNALAAYRTGAGLVRIYTPEPNRVILQQQLPEAVVTTYRDYERESLLACLSWADAVCIGSGLGTEMAAEKIVETVLRHASVPCVADADALNILAGRPEYMCHRKGSPWILTPHMKEFSRLTGKSVEDIKAGRMQLVRDFAEEYGVTCILKDTRTVVQKPGERPLINLSGCPALAKGGTGDVLAGMVAALLAQGLAERDAGALGVWLHGRAGEAASREQGDYSVLAREVADAVGKAINEMGKKRREKEVLIK